MVHILFNGTDNDLHETFIRKHHKEDEDSELGLHLQLQIICWKTHISAHKLKSHGNMADSEEKKIMILHLSISLRYQEEKSDISFRLMYETYCCSSSKLLANAQIMLAIFHQNHLFYFYIFTNSHIPIHYNSNE